jgi:RimK family alpha-L-glutamate ligase
MNQRRVVIFTDSRGWHERRLRRAFARRGVDSVLLSLKDCSIGSGASGCYGLQLPGFDNMLPDAVFVRHIPAGSFEQVTLRLDLLHALRECAVPVYNDARVIERTVDKAMTSFLLHKAGIATPPVWTCEAVATARKIFRRETAAGRKLVLKPLFGSRGNGLRLLDAASELPEPDSCNGVYYLQTFIPGADSDSDGFRDWRVMVIGGRALAAMERYSPAHWITNKAQGGECLACALDADMATLAEHAAAAVGAAYAGVDLIRDRSGNWQVLEINGIPAWSGLQSVCPQNIAQALADDLLQQIPGRPIEAVS